MEKFMWYFGVVWFIISGIMFVIHIFVAINHDDEVYSKQQEKLTLKISEQGQNVSLMELKELFLNWDKLTFMKNAFSSFALILCIFFSSVIIYLYK